MYVLLLLIFSFAFVYRLLLLLWSGFPPGADIGLHNSVIYSITGSGNTDFLYNYYHIGGGVSLTFPGYHIFTAGVMLFTGLPEYVAHAAVVSLFSALIVLCTFLITKRVFSVSAAYIVAFLAAISRFDIEMLTWAGYPNVITLMLIPLTYYLYLEKDRFTKVPFFVSTSILAGSIFLTHSLSSAMFIGILTPVILFVLLWPKAMGTQRKTVLYWVLPMVFGALLVSPFLIQAVPTYLAQYGSAEIDNAAFSRILAYWIVAPLFLIVGAFFAFSTKYYKKLLALPTFLLAMWVFVPLVCTQGYLVGAPVDYNRFLYFLVLPILVFIGILMDHGAETIALGVEKYRGRVHLGRYKVKVSKRIEGLQRKFENTGHRLAVVSTRKRIYSFCILVFLLFSFVALPIFVTPSLGVGQTLQSYYQTMDNPKWEATQWLKNNTAPGSVLVADALYGWWLGGFTQRPTLSAVDPAYLTVNREVDNASFAAKLLDTDYIIDNGYIQVREDGYASRHNPEILVKQNWTYNPYSFFTFDGNGSSIEYEINGVDQTARINDLAIKDMRIENNSDYASIIVVKGNNDFNYTLYSTLYRDVRFVNVTMTFTALHQGVTFSKLEMTIGTNGLQVRYANDLATIGLVDLGTKSFGQLIFSTTPQGDPYITKIGGVVKVIQVEYDLSEKDSGQVQLLTGAYSETNNQSKYDNQGAIDDYFLDIVRGNLDTALNKMPTDYGWDNFDYQAELHNRQASYVVLSIKDDTNPDKTELDVDAKFRLDPLFSLVFINEEVAIYRVN